MKILSLFIMLLIMGTAAYPLQWVTFLLPKKPTPVISLIFPLIAFKYPLFFQIPKYGIFENINSLKDLAQMPQWTEEKPLRVATGFTYVRNV